MSNELTVRIVDSKNENHMLCSYKTQLLYETLKFYEHLIDTGISIQVPINVSQKDEQDYIEQFEEVFVCGIDINCASEIHLLCLNVYVDI